MSTRPAGAAAAFDYAVLIGRFQPFHNGHAALLAQALACAPTVLICLGSAHAARNIKNPFTWQERARMIASTVSAADQTRLQFMPIRDHYDDARWCADVTQTVHQHARDGAKIALIGHVKDASSFYLQLFPAWTFIAAPSFGDLNATQIRQIYFESPHGSAAQARIRDWVPAPIGHFLADFSQSATFATLQTEYQAVRASQQTWGHGPFITVDAVVTCADHVLLIARGRPPGQGLWALPGGFLDADERLLQGALRELREETGLALAPSEVQNSLKQVAVFDHPGRSVRGRTLTHAHWFDLGHRSLPQVQAADDAAQARWQPIADLRALEEQLFEDHFMILDHFLGGSHKSTAS